MKKNFDMDDLFDKAARDAFKEFEMPFNSEDWKRMERKLDKKEHLLPHLWLFKGLEAIVLMLVLFTAFHLWMPTNTPTTTDDAPSNANQNNTPTIIPANVNLNKTASQDVLPNNSIVQDDQPLATTQSPSTTARIGADPTNQPSISPNTVMATSKERKQNNVIVNNTAKRVQDDQPRGFYKKQIFKNNSNSPNQNNSSIATNSTQTLHSSNLTGVENQATNNTIVENQLNSTNNNHSSTVSDNLLATAEQIALIDVLDLDKNKQLTIGDEPAINLKKATIKYPYMRQMRVGVVVGAEAHTNNSNGRGSGGYMLGVVADAEFTRVFSISGGLNVAQRSYELEQVKTVDNTASQDGLIHSVKETRKSHFTIVNIPVNAQFRLYQDKQWRVYLSTGVGASFILSKQYAGNQQTSLAQTSGGVRINTDINTNEYEGGALQNNDWKHNTFMTLQASVGVERQLGDKISLFVQPNFQQSLTKFGLNHDKTSIISLNVGIKTTL